MFRRWSAVVRGAATAGLEGASQLVKYRKCRRNYGTGCNTPFDSGKHREDEAYISVFTGRKRAGDQMRWLVKKGASLATSIDSHAKLTLIKEFWLTESKIFSIDLYASEKDQAPQRMTDVVSSISAPCH
jgi:hypothetical protein